MRECMGRFIGKTSCGFQTGTIYRLHIYTKDGKVWAEGTFSGNRCPYDTMSALIKNWEIPVKDPGPKMPAAPITTRRKLNAIDRHKLRKELVDLFETVGTYGDSRVATMATLELDRIATALEAIAGIVEEDLQ